MARLILLNGPPGIGKSTLAQRYVDEHPGVLNLDVDQVRVLVGGWRERFIETGQIVRPVAMNMAATHLAGGRDVIVPQFLDDAREVEAFATVARGSGATFCEVVLMDGKQRSLERFRRRGDQDEHPWHRHVQEIVARNGGQRLLAQMHDQLRAGLSARPNAVVLPSAEGKIEATYRSLVELLDSTA